MKNDHVSKIITSILSVYQVLSTVLTALCVLSHLISFNPFNYLVSNSFF